MSTTKFAIVFLVGIGSILTVFGVSHAILGQENDDYLIISQQTTMKQRRDFFQTLTHLNARAPYGANITPLS